MKKKSYSCKLKQHPDGKKPEDIKPRQVLKE